MPRTARALEALRVTSPPADLAASEGGQVLTLDLSGVFEDPAFDMVRFSTVSGNVDVKLYPCRAPLTVANFLNYVDDRDYDHSFIHRRDAGLHILQGGGFTFTAFDKTYPAPADYVPVPQGPPVVNEFLLNNIRGTLAMAKLGGNPDSATSQWFFNLADNRSSLDNPANNGGYTVFGVVTSGLGVLDLIFQVPVWNAAVINPAFGQLPLRDFTGYPYPDENNLVMVHEIVRLADDLSFSAQSSLPGVVGASVQGSLLTLSLAPSGIGAARVTVAAAAPDGRQAQAVFTVFVRKDMDFNQDEETDLADAVAVLKALAGLSPSGPDADRDLDENGKMGLPEALVILQYLAGMR